MKDSEKSVLLDIASAVLTNSEVLDGLSLAEFIAGFSDGWGENICGVVYPLMWRGGSTLADDRTFSSADPLPGLPLQEVSRQAADAGLELWVDVDLGLPPVRSDLVHIRQFYGSGAIQACINSEGTKKVLDLVLKQLADVDLAAPIAGFVYSLQDLWPMSGDGSVDPTCFCVHCKQSIRAGYPEFDQDFQAIPAPWRIALKDAGTGIDHIQTFSSTTTANELLNLAKVKGFVGQEDDENAMLSVEQNARAAESLLRYARARHDLTIEALTVVKETTARYFEDAVTAALISGYHYDWTAGIFLDLFVKESPFDELWMGATNEIEPIPDDVALRYYVMKRGRYYFHGLLEVIEIALTQRHPGHDEVYFGEEVKRRKASMESQLETMPLALQLIDGLRRGSYRGAVLPAISPEQAARLIDALVPESPNTPGGVPAALLELLRGGPAS